jgi:hypothetical protein
VGPLAELLMPTPGVRVIQWWREMEKADVVVISQLDFSEVVGCFPDKRYILVLSNDAATLSQSVSCSFGNTPPPPSFNSCEC